MWGRGEHVRFVIARSACQQLGAYAASIFGLTSMSRHEANVTSMADIIEHDMGFWRIVWAWPV
jgi:hypothetical protein